MGKKELFNFSNKELNVDSLLNNITSNQKSYLDYYSNNISDPELFLEKVNYIKEGIKNGNITTDGSGIYYDTNGNLSKDDKLMNNALHFIDIIAREQSKQTRSLTPSEIDQQKQEKQKLQKPQQEHVENPEVRKQNFDPEHPFNFELALKSQFGPTLEIPYNALKKSITKGNDGSEDYGAIKSRFQKAFASMRDELNKYNGSEKYINQVNDLETALLDGVWDHNDELAIHQAGLNKDFNNLKELFTYKLPKYNPRQNYKQNLEQVINPGDFTVVDGDQKTILYLDENGKRIQENITDDEYYKLSGTTVPVKDSNPSDNINIEELDDILEKDQLGWEVVGPIVADVYSIASPEPVTATLAGLASDVTGVVQDVKNEGDFHWGQHAFNFGSTILGAIPYIGDVGNIGKVGKKVVNAAGSIYKFLDSTISFLNKIPKQATKAAAATAGTAGLTWAYLDLTDEDSAILEQGKKALEAIKKGEINNETLIALGNGLAMAMQVRKGYRKYKNLDVKTPKVKTSYRDTLTTRIKAKNKKISPKDLNSIQTALDKLSNRGMFAKIRSRFGEPSEDYLSAQRLLREKGNFSEAEITEILKQVMKHAQGGVIKAETGVKTPWRRNFDGNTHQMDNIYQLFIENAQSYNAKQIAESLNKLNSDAFKTLNFENKNNTLGFKNWNTVFNESGLNNLFGYNESKSDYLGITTKSRNNFINYLKNKDIINTGNGNLSWNSEANQWEYTDGSVTNPETNPEVNANTEVNPETNPEVKAETNTEVKVEDPETQREGSQSNVEPLEIDNLTLKELNLRKPIDFNPDGIINSLAGYVANEAANAKKHKIQKEIPLYQEVMSPEKAFKTAYTYDLEKAKNEILAEANGIQPITSDASAYYAAKNDAIKNARAYTTKLDMEINNRIHEVSDKNTDIAYENAVRRTENVNTNAKYRHDWEIEQKQGEVDHLEASNQSFQNLNKELKHYAVTNARLRQRERDSYISKYVLTGLTTNPSNYINGWTKRHDLIWYKGQNGKLETDQEQAEYQQLLSIVNQASANLFAQYENIEYPGMGTLHTHETLKESWDPNKHGVAPRGAKGMKIDKQKIGNFINKLK